MKNLWKVINHNRVLLCPAIRNMRCFSTKKMRKKRQTGMENFLYWREHIFFSGWRAFNFTDSKNIWFWFAAKRTFCIVFRLAGDLWHICECHVSTGKQHEVSKKSQHFGKKTTTCQNKNKTKHESVWVSCKSPAWHAHDESLVCDDSFLASDRSNQKN